MNPINIKQKSGYIIKQLVLIICAFMVMLGAVEGLLRLQSGLKRTDDIPYVLVDGLRVFTSNVDTIVTGGAFVPIHVKTNVEGYASPDYPVTAASGTIRVAVLGNSFTRGFEVDYDKKFTSLAEEYLRNDGRPGDRRYEVLNFGIGGYSFVDQFFVYERYVKKYHPQLVLLAVYPPIDFSTTRVFLPEEEYIFKTPTARLAGARLLGLEPVFSDSQSSAGASSTISELELWRFARRLFAGVTERLRQLSLNQGGVLHRPLVFLYDRLARLGSRLGLVNIGAARAITLADDYRNYFNPYDADRLALMRFTARLALKLGETVLRDGGKFGAVMIPSYWSVDNKYSQQLAESVDPSYDYFLPNKIFQEVVAAKFPILDLSDSLKRAINEARTQVFIRDTGHFTAAGHQMAARSIVDFIKQEYSPVP